MSVISPFTLTGPINGHYMEAAEAIAISTAAVATESFSFTLDMPAECDTASLHVAIENIKRALTTWESQLSHMLNDCVGRTFDANRRTVRLLTADMNNYAHEMRRLDTMRNEKGISESAYRNLTLQYDGAKDQYERASNRAADMRRAILMPPAIVSAAKRTNALAMQAFMLLERHYSRYKAMCADGSINADELAGMTDDLELDGVIKKQLDFLSSRIDIICRTEIYGKAVDPSSPESNERYEFSLMTAVTRQFNLYREMTRDLYARVSDLERALTQLEHGEDAGTTITAIYTEIMFLLVYLPVYGDLMQLYFEPKMAIINSIDS